MNKLTVGLPRNRCEILIGEGVLDELGPLIRPFCNAGEPAAVVTDENVWERYGGQVTASAEGAGIVLRPVVLPPGEGNKSLDGLAGVYGAFAGMKLKRSGLAVALGGGVIGDLCGFAASTYMRGIRYIQVPTTLLAQVDSSVGGKTAINLEQGKNLAGSFYQPQMVVIDTLTLKSLPRREWRGGMAEVVKYGAILSADLFDTLREGPENVPMTEVIPICCRLKNGIVERDEKDFGERMLLNFGHTFGHAIEKRFGYGEYNHGEAVAIGMVIAAAVGEEMGLTEKGCAGALRNVLESYGLRTGCPVPLSELLPLMEIDKKSGGDGVRLVLLRRIGESFVKQVGFAQLGEILKRVESR